MHGIPRIDETVVVMIRIFEIEMQPGFNIYTRLDQIHRVPNISGRKRHALQQIISSPKKKKQCNNTKNGHLDWMHQNQNCP